MNNLFVKTDSRFIDFSIDPEEQGLIDAVAKMANQIEGVGSGAAANQDAISKLVREVKEVQVAELVIALQDESLNPARVLFLIAETLAAADLEIAWCGLNDVPSALLAHIAGVEHAATDSIVAYSVHHDQPNTRLLAYVPAGLECQAFWLWKRPDQLLYMSADAISAVGQSMSREHLIGFRGGRELTITLGESNAAIAEQTADQWLALNPQQSGQIKTYLFAFYAGLLLGGVNRAVKEAYQYAKVRESFGKPINQHQAVALRLADIAVNSEAARMYAEEALEQQAFADADYGLASAQHVAELSNQVVTDALQVAGAHGYVEGLPFKRIYERIRALSIAFELAMHPGSS